MSKFDLALEKATKQLQDCGVNADAEFLTKVAKGLGPALYNRDASLVAFSSTKELETVKNNFLIKKLGLTNEDQCAQALEAVKEKLSSINQKQRLVVYYLLAKEVNMEHIYN